MIKNIRKLFKLKKGDKVLKDKIIEIIKIFSNQRMRILQTNKSC